VGRDDEQDQGLQQIREDLDARIQAERYGAGGMPAPYHPVAPPPAAQAEGPRVRASMGYAGALGGANSYMEMLVQRRDSQAAQRISRSANSWSAENKRPGSWMSGVGNITPVGTGRQYASGIGRPLIQQRDS